MKKNILEISKEVYRLLEADPVCRGQAARVKGLVSRLEKGDMTVAVIGQFKRGKSALANRVLGDKILPVGIVPVTSAITLVSYGKRAAEVRFKNGAVEPVGFERLHEFISNEENADNRLGVESVVLHTPSEFLKNGLTLADTPGVGSFHRNNTEVAYRCMKESDAVIFLLSVDSPINRIEIDFLRNTGEFAGKFYFAVNKIDVIDKEDLDKYMEYCENLLRTLTESGSVHLFPVSAKTGEGVGALKEAILRDCGSSIKEIMEESAKKKLKDVINGALAQLGFYWKAMNMEYKELDAKFGAISKAVEEIREDAETKSGAFEVFLNEYRIRLSQTVFELFGMEYHFDIETLPPELIVMGKEKFLAETHALCRDLQYALDRALLYREENAYALCRRIEDINILTRKLRAIRGRL